MNTVYKISLSDFRLIFREDSLRAFLFVPPIIIAATVWGVPKLVVSFPIIEEFTVYILMGSLTQTSVMFGFIYSMVLVEEKETGVASVYGVIPVNQYVFVVTRLLIPTILSCGAAYILLILQPFFDLSISDSILISIQSGLATPFIGLIVAIFAKNKMEGMTWFKAVDMVVILPIASFFVAEPFNFIFSFLPTFWPFTELNNAISGLESPIFTIIGTFYIIGLVVYLIKIFCSRHYS